MSPGRRRVRGSGVRAIGMISFGAAALAACSEDPDTANPPETQQAANAIADSAASNAAPGEADSPVAVRVRTLVSNELGVPLSRVTDQARLIDDLGADSLDIVEIVMGIEEEFGVEIPDVAAEQLVTVGDFISYLEVRTRSLSD